PVVTEVPLQLADDGGRGKGTEAVPSIGAVPAGRLDEPEHRHLYEVVTLDASSLETPRESDREPTVGDHDLLADARRPGGVGLLAGPPELERGVTIALTVVAGLITDNTGHGYSS